MGGQVVRGSGRGEVELEFPDPARVVLLTLEAGTPHWPVVLRGQGEEGSPQRPEVSGHGRVAVLLPPERQRSMRRVTVGTSVSWTLRLHDPDGTVELGTGAAGSGPRILEHRGGTARVVVTQSDDAAGALRVLHYPEGPGGPPVVAADTGGTTLSTLVRNGFLLDGPQFVVVEYGEDWSFAVEPADLPPSAPLVRHGFGNATEFFDRPSPGRPAVLEMTLESGRCGISVLGEDGGRLARHSVNAALGPVPIPLWGGRKDAALGRLGLRVEDGDSAWRMTLRPDRPERRLVGRAEGAGDELLRYEGPPAVLSVRHPPGADGRLALDAPDGRVSGPHRGERCGSLLVGAAPHPEVIAVTAAGGWALEVTLPEEARPFSDRLTGCGSEVVRWTGGRARLTVRNRPRHRRLRWPGSALGAAVWSPDGPRDAAAAHPDPPRRDAVLFPGCLVLVHDPHHSGWRLVAD
ncbi:hypothetical protein [Kitasatospora sp. NPDC015120]|uniref:hypothetical protein n=1 Tax=Kitasatospora sp. NPDC015120 TaxID=3364023 RepID=UPI0036F49EC4